MPPTVRIAHVALRVTDLDRSRAFYVHRVGFHAVAHSDRHLALATAPGGPPSLTLRAGAVAEPPRPVRAGLFHAALLFPSRAALAGWLAFAAARRLDFDGAADHGVSEALYFSDPDGNGLEFYRDRPAADWPRRAGELAMTSDPVDLPGLLADAPATPAPAPLVDADWGHLHFRVTDLDRSEAFYRETLGFAVTQHSFPGARFMAADGYHHHLGLNVWGRPILPSSTSAPGLDSATLAVRGLATARDLADPDGLPLRLVPA